MTLGELLDALALVTPHPDRGRHSREVIVDIADGYVYAIESIEWDADNGAFVINAVTVEDDEEAEDEQ